MHATEAAPALLPIVQFIYVSGGPDTSVISAQDRQCAIQNLQYATTSLADNACIEKVALLRAAFVLTKMASCVQYNRDDSPNALIWRCLIHLSGRLAYATATTVSKETQHEEKALCMMLTQTMLSVLRWSAKHHQQHQHKGKVALGVLIAVVNCEAVDLACLADLILKSGKFPPEVCSCSTGLSTLTAGKPSCHPKSPCALAYSTVLSFYDCMWS